jgi:hypothetical protein
VIVRLPEQKLRGLVTELVRRVGTKQQRAAFNLENDDQSAPVADAPVMRGAPA